MLNRLFLTVALPFPRLLSDLRLFLSCSTAPGMTRLWFLTAQGSKAMIFFFPDGTILLFMLFLFFVSRIFSTRENNNTSKYLHPP